MRQSYAETLTARARARRPMPPQLERQIRLAGLEPLPRVLLEMLGTGARLGDEIDPRLAWQSIRELLDDVTSAGLTGAGAAEVRAELLELSARARYDRVRRALEQLVDLELAVRSGVNAEPRPRVVVYSTAPFPA